MDQRSDRRAPRYTENRDDRYTGRRANRHTEARPDEYDERRAARSNARRRAAKQAAAKRRKRNRIKRRIRSLSIIFTMLVLAVLLLEGVYLGISGIHRAVTKGTVIEAGTGLPAAESFFKKGKEDAVYTKTPTEEELCTPGNYQLVISSNGKEYKKRITIVDTQAPEITPKDRKLVLGRTLEPEDFILEAKDAQTITYEYVKTPDFNQEGEQDLQITGTDASGNRATVLARLTIGVDTEAPVIEGVEDKKVYLGEAISYKSGITISDNFDDEEDLTLEIDHSAVDQENVGTYKVYYTVKDSSGNEAQAAATIMITDAEQEEMEAKVKELAEKALKTCITSDMKSREKLEAIFYYVKHNMSYNGKSDKSNEVKEALNAFETGHGDCYTYFAMLKVMMEEAGFETVDVSRINGETNHYWSLVNVDGEWYHIDACPRSVEHHKEWICFLRTDAELEMFSTEMVKGYYTFDKDLVPRTP